MSLTGSVSPISCHASGVGNIAGDGPDDSIADGDTIFLSKIGDSGAGDQTLLLASGLNSNGPGTITVTRAVDGYANLILALKMGDGGDGGMRDPDWFAWLVPNAAATYTWNWIGDSRETGLSHVNLYGEGVSAIPLPAPALLLVGGLLGLGALRRKQRTATA